MKRIAVALLLASAAWPTVGESRPLPQPLFEGGEIKPPPPQVFADDAARAKKLSELSAWLRRLQGNFSVKGTVLDATLGSKGSHKPSGSMQCSGIGTGPGVLCLVNVTWARMEELSGYSDTLGQSEVYNTLSPAMMLFALDPQQLELELTLVDSQGNGESWTGQLAGNAVVFWKVPGSGCWGIFMYPHCPRRISMLVEPGDKVARLEMDYPLKINLWDINLEFHRQANDKTNAAPGKP